MAEEERGLLERLVITEEGDVVASSSLLIVRSRGGETALKGEEEHTAEEDEGEEEEETGSDMRSEEQERAAKQHADAKEEEEGDSTGEVVVTEEKAEKTKSLNDGQNRGGSETMRINDKPEKPSDTGDEAVTQNDPDVDFKRLNSSEKQEEEDPKTVRRLTPDFPEALYELLCTLQEGRRLNDQRCSFMLEGGMGRRRCHSEPNTSKPANRVVFSSMTSLQKEEFFELVATAQARRLDDQRAQLEKSQPSKPKSRGFRGSIRQLSLMKRPAPAPAPVPVPVPKEDLYNMILTTQAQGRLEDQRSRAPGPMDDEDFFSLLLRVQGGRMDEQRTELPLPCMLQT